MASAEEHLEDGVYALAVDKGTLDYFLCGEAEHAIDALANVHAALLDQGERFLEEGKGPPPPRQGPVNGLF